MSLSTRVSLFFLCVLMCILMGFSVILYFLAKDHFLHEVEEELEGVMNTLVAAVELTADSVEWEPGDRRPAPVEIHHGSELSWVVQDNHGKVVGQSSPQLPVNFALLLKQLQDSKEPMQESREYRHDRWYVLQRYIRANGTGTLSNDATKHLSLCITAALTYEPTLTSLQYLRWTLFGLSLGIFVPILFLGRFLCNRALRPITQMAHATKVMQTDQLDQRLLVPETRDELADLSQSFNGLLDRLQISFERQKRFTGDASHQLRTPMAAILGNVEVALRRERSAAEYQHTLQVVEARAQHVVRIIEALLFLSRADAEAQGADYALMDLSQWLSSHMEEWSSHQRFNDIHLTVPNVKTDVFTHSVLLGELLDNLIDNACKYSSPGTSIDILLKRDDGLVELTIRDHGIGIDSDDLEKVFEPFFRSHQISKEPRHGVGLGLTIARRIAQALQLTLNVKSALGAGTTFVVRFASTAGKMQ